MKNKYKHLLSLFVILLIGIFTWYSFSFQKIIHKVLNSFFNNHSTKFLTQKKSEKNRCEIIMKHIKLKEIKRDKKTGWVLTSPESKFFQSLNVIECTEATCTLLTNDTDVATLYAKKSIINRLKNNIFIPESFKINFKGLNMKGREILYTFSSHQLTTNKNAYYSHKNFSLSAEKSLIDLKKNRIVLDKGVESKFFK